MMSPKLKIKRLERNGEKPPMPYYASKGAAGLDLTYFGDEEITLIPGEIEKLNNAVILYSGNIAVLCVAADSDNAKAVIENLIF